MENVALDVMQYLYPKDTETLFYTNSTLYNESEITRKRLIKDKYIQNGKLTEFAKSKIEDFTIRERANKVLNLLRYLEQNGIDLNKATILEGTFEIVWEDEGEIQDSLTIVEYVTFEDIFYTTIWERDLIPEDSPYTFDDLYYWFNLNHKNHSEHDIYFVKKFLKDVINCNERCIKDFFNTRTPSRFHDFATEADLKWSIAELTATNQFLRYLNIAYPNY